jgi:flagellar basal-body rod protein FlgB
LVNRASKAKAWHRNINQTLTIHPAKIAGRFMLEEIAMPISKLPILDMLRTKMQWHQERQRLLAENIANADTPKFQPRDLTPPSFDRAPVAQPVALQRTSSAHVASAMSGESAAFQSTPGGSETRPSGNAVSLEDEMLKVAKNQMDYQAAATLYSKSLGLVKTAIGKR